MAFRSLVAGLARRPPLSVVAEIAERLDPGLSGLFGVLTYHRVVDEEASLALWPGLISANPREFERHVQLLAERYRVVSMGDVVAARAGRGHLPPRAVLVTFDDAYRDFLDHAWPVLRRHGLPTTVFVPTGYPDHPDRGFWWDRLYMALQLTHRSAVSTPWERLELSSQGSRLAAFDRTRTRLKAVTHDAAMSIVDDLVAGLGQEPAADGVLGWESLRQLAADGVCLAPHSRTHPLLTRVEVDRVQAEVHDSVRDLERETGPVLPVFAYPGGAANAEVKRRVAAAGIQLAFTTTRGLNLVGRSDWMALRRINVGRRSSVPLIKAQLSSLNAGSALRSPVT